MPHFTPPNLETPPKLWGGELKIIGAIIDAPVIDSIFTHPGLAARVPPRRAIDQAVADLAPASAA